MRTFSQYSALRLGAGEGNLSNDDRRVALFGRNSQGELVDAFDYDLVANAITGVLTLPMAWSDVQTIASTMSQSGNFVVVEYASRGTGSMQGKKVYDTQMKLQAYYLTRRKGHADLGLDVEAGNDVMVTVDAPSGRGNDRSSVIALRR